MNFVISLYLDWSKSERQRESTDFDFYKTHVCILLSSSNGSIMKDTLSFLCNVVRTIFYSVFPNLLVLSLSTFFPPSHLLGGKEFLAIYFNFHCFSYFFLSFKKKVLFYKCCSDNFFVKNALVLWYTFLILGLVFYVKK
jgi:hypothetical protein